MTVIISARFVKIFTIRFSIFQLHLRKRLLSSFGFYRYATFLIEMLQRMDFSLTLLEKMEVKDEDFDKATEVITDPIPVLYQSGYLTIKGYEPLFVHIH